MTTRHRFSKTSPHGIDFTDAKPLTKQSSKDECDINKIMKRFVKTGIVEHGNAHAAQYGSVPAHDFREAMELLDTTEQMFSELPATIRRRFQNDPAQYLAFCEEPKNLEEAITLGLAHPEDPKPATEPAPEPTPPEPASSTPT